MRLGYSTNGFAHHRFEDAVAILAEIGYQSVAITLDHHVLNPYGPELEKRTAAARQLLIRHGMRSVVETGARFLLDSRVKHHPTLVSATLADRERRIDFLCRAIDIAQVLGSDAVSFWSGSLRDQVQRAEAMARLVAGCRRVLGHAIKRGLRLAFEPEPGMLVARMSDFSELLAQIEHPFFGLTIDIGHLHCVDDGPIPEVLGQWKDRLFNVHIEDMRRGVHDHLMFGDGEIDFASVLAKLHEIGFAGGLHVELSRHSHDAVETAKRAYAFLRPLVSVALLPAGSANVDDRPQQVSPTRSDMRLRRPFGFLVLGTLCGAGLGYFLCVVCGLAIVGGIAATAERTLELTTLAAVTGALVGAAVERLVSR